MLKTGGNFITRAFRFRTHLSNATRTVSTTPPAVTTPPAEEGRRYIPRRACLYVPGNDEAKLKKIPAIGADCVILDCEDGVAANRKV